MSKLKSSPQRLQNESQKIAIEVIEHVYNTIILSPDLILSDGLRAKIVCYIVPSVDKCDGKLHCGFNVEIEDGSHLEFVMKNTGSGKSFADTVKFGSRGLRRDR